jgi:hypothetical protein
MSKGRPTAQWQLIRDAIVIMGEGKRATLTAVDLRDIVGIEITTEAPEYTKPIQYTLKLSGGYELTVTEPDEIEALRALLAKVAQLSGGKVIYI